MGKSVSGPLGRARQVLDLRRSLQKLDLAERELATAFVGTVVSSALPASASGASDPPHAASPWVGRLGGVVEAAGGEAEDDGGALDGFRDLGAVRDDAAAGDAEVLEEVAEEDFDDDGWGESKEEERDSSQSPSGGGSGAAGQGQQAPDGSRSFETGLDRRRTSERRQSRMSVEVDSSSAPSNLGRVSPPRGGSVPDSAQTGANGGSVGLGCANAEKGHEREAGPVVGGSQQATPTEREEKEGLERLLDALTPQRKPRQSPKGSPHKQPASVRSSVGFRRSMRSSLSIQLGIVAASQAVSAPSAAGSSAHSKSSSSGLGSSSRFRGLGALSSPDVAAPGSASQEIPLSSHSSANSASTGGANLECATPAHGARLPPHVPSHPSVTAGEPSLAVRELGESTLQRDLDNTDHCLIGRWGTACRFRRERARDLGKLASLSRMASLPCRRGFCSMSTLEIDSGFMGGFVVRCGVSCAEARVCRAQFFL